jgi:hypothetical protein
VDFPKTPVSVEGRSKRSRFLELARTFNRVQTALSVGLGDGAMAACRPPKDCTQRQFGSVLCVEEIISSASLPSFTAKTRAAEFQKILDQRGVVISDPIGALAHPQLARAYTLSDYKSKAQAAYRDFLTLWRDADRDIPILQRARAEYAIRSRGRSVDTKREADDGVSC